MYATEVFSSSELTWGLHFPRKILLSLENRLKKLLQYAVLLNSRSVASCRRSTLYSRLIWDKFINFTSSSSDKVHGRCQSGNQLCLLFGVHLHLYMFLDLLHYSAVLRGSAPTFPLQTGSSLILTSHLLIYLNSQEKKTQLHHLAVFRETSTWSRQVLNYVQIRFIEIVQKSTHDILSALLFLKKCL